MKNFAEIQALKIPICEDLKGKNTLSLDIIAQLIAAIPSVNVAF
ncbi:hypothetical protein [Chamaesiphon sp. OTE_75_metabat_556]|nr:hypothetical protein [Chamaesiphon sp. OTE_75_metabat_556]